MTPADLRAWRRSRHLTQREAAGMLGVSVRVWCAWERGELPVRKVVTLALEAVAQRLLERRAGVW